MRRIAIKSRAVTGSSSYDRHVTQKLDFIFASSSKFSSGLTWFHFSSPVSVGFRSQAVTIHSLTGYDDSLARHRSVSFALGPSEEGLCEDQVAPQQHRDHHQQLDHFPV